ncbi:MAG TPA: hypothetical protein VI914_02230 [Thermodesulfobacteriota bacterium]|nr:hypothetical protein [Thermodesulfobacteriota bacterium]
MAEFFNSWQLKMEELEELLSKLLKDIMSLPERPMQLRLLGKRLSSLPPEKIAGLLSALYTKDRSFSHALKSLLVDPQGLKDMLGARKYRLTYLASIEMGFKKVSRLLTDLPPHKKGVRGYDKEEEAKMEFLSLGQRRALSKSPAKDTLDRLLSDPDPMVIQNILNNPRITEKEAVRIASKRPNSPSVLKLLATHRKWATSYTVARAVVLNPYTPPRISVSLLELLLTQDLKLIARDRTLHPQVRMGANDLLEERK